MIIGEAGLFADEPDGLIVPAIGVVKFLESSNGGVLVTEWHVNPAVPTERMKVSVSILDPELRADALRVSASRQIQQNGQWVDAAVQAATNQKLEEIILQKARDLRRNGAG